MSELVCTWCGAPVEQDSGYRAAEPAGQRRAVFCRLEHVVPWALQGAHWEAGSAPEPPEATSAMSDCAQCGTKLEDVRVTLVRHRGEHRIPDAFCSVGHAADWAKAGGRWR